MAATSHIALSVGIPSLAARHCPECHSTSSPPALRERWHFATPQGIGLALTRVHGRTTEYPRRACAAPQSVRSAAAPRPVGTGQSPARHRAGRDPHCVRDPADQLRHQLYHSPRTASGRPAHSGGHVDVHAGRDHLGTALLVEDGARLHGRHGVHPAGHDGGDRSAAWESARGLGPHGPGDLRTHRLFADRRGCARGVCRARRRHHCTGDDRRPPPASPLASPSSCWEVR